MSNYRPICDLWILARAKLNGGEKYYGAYLGGFVERARVIIGCRMKDPMLHVCGGKAKFYPYKRGFGPNDMTLDIDKNLNPDFLQDARTEFPLRPRSLKDKKADKPHKKWRGILIDPPYSEQEAENYAAGARTYPKPSELLKNASSALLRGARVGIIHYIWPSPPKDMMCVAEIGIVCGYNNRIRNFAVYERT